MKYILLISALIFTMPAWAAETAAASAVPQAAAAKSATAKPSAQEAPAAKTDKQAAPKKKTKKKKKVTADLTCPTGCATQTCGGVPICAKNKPFPICTAC